MHYPLRVCRLYRVTGAYLLADLHQTINSTASTAQYNASVSESNPRFVWVIFHLLVTRTLHKSR